MANNYVFVGVFMSFSVLTNCANASDIITVTCTKTSDGRYLDDGDAVSSTLKALGYKRYPHFEFLQYKKIKSNPCDANGACEDEGVCTYRLQADPKGSIYF